MNKFIPIALLATFTTLFVAPSQVFAAEAAPQVKAAADSVAATATATVGKMLYGPDAKRIASIYRVNANGDAQIILEGRLITVRAATLSIDAGKVATSLTKSQILRR